MGDGAQVDEIEMPVIARDLARSRHAVYDAGSSGSGPPENIERPIRVGPRRNYFGVRLAAWFAFVILFPQGIAPNQGMIPELTNPAKQGLICLRACPASSRKTRRGMVPQLFLKRRIRERVVSLTLLSG
jgi:hypothetical protein